MNMFSRAVVSPETVKAENLAQSIGDRVKSHTDYAAYTSIETGVKGYDAATTLAGLDVTLGRRVTKHLLADCGESTLHVGAEIMKVHAQSESLTTDLQTTLLVNIVKELAANESSSSIERRGYCEDLLRRCTLAPDYKQHVLKSLTPKEVIDSSMLVAVPL